MISMEPIIVTPFMNNVIMAALMGTGFAFLLMLCAYFGFQYTRLRVASRDAMVVLPKYRELGALVRDYLDNRDAKKGDAPVWETYQDLLRTMMKETLDELEIK